MSSNTTRTARSPSPKRSPQASSNSSPKRRPLHERSDSQTNQHSSPTIRIVEDPGAQIYSKTPFPSHPSQILPPRKAPAGYAFEDRGLRVSDRNDATNTVPNPDTVDTLVPKPLQPRRANRSSASTTSDADTIVNNSPFSPSSSRFSSGTSPPVSPTAPGHERLGDLGALQESVPQPKRSTIRAVIPSSSSEGHALTPRASAASLTSTASSETFAHRTHEDRRPPSSSDPLTPPLRSHKRPPPTSSNGKKKQASPTNRVPLKPILKTSSESLAFSDISYDYDRPKSSSSASVSSSPTIHAARQVSLESGVRVQFPIVRPPSASGLWAESRVLPKHPSRMNNRASQVHQWSSQLSTIASESERGSQQISDRGSQQVSDRSSQSVEPRRSPPAPRRQTISSVASSDNVVYNSEPTDSSVSVPLPLFSPSLRPPEGRESDEHRDVVSPLQSPPPLRQQRSGYLGRQSSNDSRPGSRPGSSQSDFANFIASTIPAWARVYYRRGERTSIGAPDSSTEASDSRLPTAQSGRTQTPSEGNFPLSIYRPRNRPHQRQSQSQPQSEPVRDSMAISISNEPIEQEISVFGPMMRGPISEPFTPRLRINRRSNNRLSAWRAPSFDEPFGSKVFSRQNRQILLFCLGFIFPFSWMIASFLPLPPNPEVSKEATPSQVDVERAFAQHVGPVDGRSYQKALWWRNLNRIMSAVGILLVGAIIALAIVASRMK